MRLEMLPAVLASELWKYLAGRAGQRRLHAVHGVVRPQTLKTEVVGIGDRYQAGARRTGSSLEDWRLHEGMILLLSFFFFQTFPAFSVLLLAEEKKDDSQEA